jgi:glycine hydroxymethyltransferase
MSIKSLSDLLEIVRLHENWRTRECLNLAAAENASSHSARELLRTDLGNRYTNPKGSNFHRGTKFLDEIHQLAEDFAKQTFNAKFADVRPISGHLADMAVVMSLTRRGDKVLSLSAMDGGYPGTSQKGLGKFLGLSDVFFPFDKRVMNINVEDAQLLIGRQQPRLVVFGASYILFPQPVREICAASEGAVHVYDGSHVLGLIAGGEFQDPLREGCSLLLGSTHKSFPGPQGGIIVSNDPVIFGQVADNMMPGIIDNIHLHRIAALAVSLLEMREFGKTYAKAVVGNARALGRSLEAHGIKVKCSGLGYSSSHQVHLDYEARELEIFADLLEKANMIIDNGGRLGVAEVTRLGMGLREMEQIAPLIALVLHGEESADSVKKRVVSIAREFTEPKFVLY